MNKTVEVFLKHLVNELNDRGPAPPIDFNLTKSIDDAIKKNIEAGRKYLDRKEYKQAIFQFEDALYYVSTTKEEKREIHNMYGKALIGLEQYEDAIKKFQKALDYSYTSDEKKEAYNMLAFSQRKLAGSLLDKSKENYINSLDLDSNYAPALEYYGELLLQMNDLETLENKEILDRIHSEKEEFGELACKIRQFIDKSKKNQEKFKSVEGKINDFTLKKCGSLGYIDTKSDNDW